VTGRHTTLCNFGEAAPATAFRAPAVADPSAMIPPMKSRLPMDIQLGRLSR